MTGGGSARLTLKLNGKSVDLPNSQELPETGISLSDVEKKLLELGTLATYLGPGVDRKKLDPKDYIFEFLLDGETFEGKTVSREQLLRGEWKVRLKEAPKSAKTGSGKSKAKAKVGATPLEGEAGSEKATNSPGPGTTKNAANATNFNTGLGGGLSVSDAAGVCATVLTFGGAIQRIKRPASGAATLDYIKNTVLSLGGGQERLSDMMLLADPDWLLNADGSATSPTGKPKEEETSSLKFRYDSFYREADGRYYDDSKHTSFLWVKQTSLHTVRVGPLRSGAETPFEAGYFLAKLQGEDSVADLPKTASDVLGKIRTSGTDTNSGTQTLYHLFTNATPDLSAAQVKNEDQIWAFSRSSQLLPGQVSYASPEKETIWVYKFESAADEPAGIFPYAFEPAGAPFKQRHTGRSLATSIFANRASAKFKNLGLSMETLVEVGDLSLFPVGGLQTENGGQWDGKSGEEEDDISGEGSDNNIQNLRYFWVADKQQVATVYYHHVQSEGIGEVRSLRVLLAKSNGTVGSLKEKVLGRLQKSKGLDTKGLTVQGHAGNYQLHSGKLDESRLKGTTTSTADGLNNQLSDHHQLPLTDRTFSLLFIGLKGDELVFTPKVTVEDASDPAIGISSSGSTAPAPTKEYEISSSVITPKIDDFTGLHNAIVEDIKKHDSGFKSDRILLAKEYGQLPSLSCKIMEGSAALKHGEKFQFVQLDYTAGSEKKFVEESDNSAEPGSIELYEHPFGPLGEATRKLPPEVVVSQTKKCTHRTTGKWLYVEAEGGATGAPTNSGWVSQSGATKLKVLRTRVKVKLNAEDFPRRPRQYEQVYLSDKNLGLSEDSDRAKFKEELEKKIILKEKLDGFVADGLGSSCAGKILEFSWSPPFKFSKEEIEKMSHGEKSGAIYEFTVTVGLSASPNLEVAVVSAENAEDPAAILRPDLAPGGGPPGAATQLSPGLEAPGANPALGLTRGSSGTQEKAVEVTNKRSNLESPMNHQKLVCKAVTVVIVVVFIFLFVFWLLLVACHRDPECGQEHSRDNDALDDRHVKGAHDRDCQFQVSFFVFMLLCSVVVCAFVAMQDIGASLDTKSRDSTQSIMIVLLPIAFGLIGAAMIVGAQVIYRDRFEALPESTTPIEQDFNGLTVRDDVNAGNDYNLPPIPRTANYDLPPGMFREVEILKKDLESLRGAQEARIQTLDDHGLFRGLWDRPGRFIVLRVSTVRPDYMLYPVITGGIGGEFGLGPITMEESDWGLLRYPTNTEYRFGCEIVKKNGATTSVPGENSQRRASQYN